MSEAVRFSQVDKVYRGIGSRSLRESLSRWLRPADPASQSASEFRALEDVSFDIAAGEAFGLVGRNGAGKSTVLKILSKVTAPTSGEVRVRGRVGSLLEVGTGFHPELSGRENVQLSAAIHGMSPARLRSRFDEIVAFSEVERFLDMPVKRYSSGMYTRLAFAVAAHLDPDILLVDEALSVGDVQFQRKCVARMRQLLAESRTVVLVSHNQATISNFCRRALWLDQGRVARIGDAGEVVAAYLESTQNRRMVVQWSGDEGDDRLRLRSTWVRFPDPCGASAEGAIRIGFCAEILRPLQDLVAAVELGNEHGMLIAYSAHDDALPPPAQEHAPGSFSWELEIPSNTLAAGTYSVNFDFGIHNRLRIIDRVGGLQFELKSGTGPGRRFPVQQWHGLFRPAWKWLRVDP